MPGVDFKAVRCRVSMAQVLERIGFVPAECSGDQLRGPCPVQGSNSPKSRSFSANPPRNASPCFKCRSSGNQLDLWAVVTKTDLHTAALDLCEKFDLDVPWVRKQQPTLALACEIEKANREEEPVLSCTQPSRGLPTDSGEEPFFHPRKVPRGWANIRASGKLLTRTLLPEIKNPVHTNLPLSSYFDSLIRLKQLGLHSTSIGDQGLAKLGVLSNLELLDLGFTKTTDRGLSHLQVCANLRIVNLMETQVSKAGLAELRIALPNCVIHSELFDVP